MERLILVIALIVLVMILAKLPTSVMSDTSTSLAVSNTLNNGITTNQTQTSDCSASATITMYAVADE